MKNDTEYPTPIPQRPILKRLLDMSTGLWARFWFSGSAQYWNSRYRLKGSSGSGSYGKSACFKAEFVNNFVREKRINTVIEFGCGDGAQLSLLEIRNYIGVDVSDAAVERCQRCFAADQGKRFIKLTAYSGESAELAISLDVIFHLVEDEVFHDYMNRLFASSRRFVIIYSTDRNDISTFGSVHVRHRHVSKYCRDHFPDWRMTFQGSPLEKAGIDGPRFLVLELRSWVQKE